MLFSDWDMEVAHFDATNPLPHGGSAVSAILLSETLTVPCRRRTGTCRRGLVGFASGFDGSESWTKRSLPASSVRS